MEQIQDKELWNRQQGETSAAFEAFSLYRDMGAGRTAAAVSQKLQKSYTLICRWRKCWAWDERADAWDESILAAARRRAQEELQAMIERHIAQARELQDKAAAALDALDPATLTPAQILEFLRFGTDLERISRHGTLQDRQMDFRREVFEYQKGRDAGAGVELEDLSDVEADIYGEEATMWTRTIEGATIRESFKKAKKTPCRQKS